VLNYLSTSRTRAAQLQIQSFASALDLFFLDNGRYPSTSEGLKALVTAPSGSTGWGGPYIQQTQVPADPWGNPYEYRVPATEVRTGSCPMGGWPGWRDGRQRRSLQRVTADAAVVSCARPLSDTRVAATRSLGFTLVELLLALAVFGLIAALALPRVLPNSGATEVRIKAFQIAALLRSDRNAALRTGRTVATVIDLPARRVRSGASRTAVDLPDRMAFRWTGEMPPGFRFAPNGTSSGGELSVGGKGVGLFGAGEPCDRRRIRGPQVAAVQNRMETHGTGIC
jgi:general secretion pathway protein G